MKENIRQKKFWEKVDKSQSCWIWIGYRNHDGYGLFQNKNKMMRAHRYAYEITKGPIPEKLIICHLCDNPSCVNPDHLFLGDKMINKIDSVRKGRTKICGNQPIKLNEEKVKKIREKLKNQTGAEIAREFNVSETAIYSIKYNRSWAWVN